MLFADARPGRRPGRWPVGKDANMATSCTHVGEIRDVTPSASGCEDCQAAFV